MPLLELRGISKRFGDVIAARQLDLTVRRGEFFTFLGPSGSGKSTLLRIIAGLERPDDGRVVIDGKDVTSVPPWDRGLGMVFQQYAVFPHMTVAQNVAYGLRVRNVPPEVRRQRVAELLALVGLKGKEEANVAVLSGGEQQRVALARSLAVHPKLLLLDEPLGALDEKIRRDMQTELKHIQQQTGTTFIYVTHDQEEALTMSDRIAVLHEGHLVQCDLPEVLFRRPRTRFVASFFRGSNVLEAMVEEVKHGRLVLRLAGKRVIVPQPVGRQVTTGPVAVAIRAEDLQVRPREGMHLWMEATLVEVVYRGTNVDHVLALDDGQRLVAASTRREVDRPGMRIPVGVEPEQVVLLED